MEAKVLAVGLAEKSAILAELPIYLLTTDTGMEAIRRLKAAGRIDTLVSCWDLPDMKDGELIKRIKAARPWLPSIVLLDEPYQIREAMIRELGVTAVLPSTIEAQPFLQVIEQVLALERFRISTPSEPCQCGLAVMNRIE